ncbi:AAA family ATPase [Arthrospira platensis BEA 1257B]
MVDVIYDATNVQRRRRRDLIAQVRGFGFQSVVGLWVNTPLEVCLARNERRSRQVPEGVILQMYRQLTDAPPTLSDGFDRLLEIQNI